MVKVRQKHASNSVAKVDQNRSKKKRKRTEVDRNESKKKRKRTIVVGGYFGRLPSEILHDIALRLTVTSIIQLRRSSKFWYDLLTDPEFVDLNLTQSLQKPPGYLFFPRYYLTRRANPLEIHTVEPSQSRLSTSKIFRFSTKRPITCLRDWIKSSGGLMCVYSKKSNHFRIFNPHINEEVQVPGIPKSKNYRDIKWFFSYSPSTKEYKILTIKILHYNASKRSTVATISTLGSDIWTKIRNVPSFTGIDSFVECQGNLFFWTSDSNFVSFDIVSEKFRVIPAPQHGHPRYEIFGTSLISMGDTVGYVRDCTLWVLRDKTKGIWIKIDEFSIPYSLLYKIHFTGVLENNDGLFGFVKGSTKVFTYDIGGPVYRVTKIDNGDEGKCKKTGGWSARYAGTHVRSLVSPVRIMENGRKLRIKS